MASAKKPNLKKQAVSGKNKKPDNRRNMIILSLMAIIALTFIVFYNSLHNSFVTNLDDTTYIASASELKKLAFSDIIKIFTTLFAGNYHPLAVLSLTLDYRWYGENAFPFHLVSLVFHLANAALVFWFIYLLLKRIDAAVIVALFFAIHPMHVESVSWISERKDALYAFFFLGSLISYLLYLRYDKKYRYLVVSLFLFLLSLLSKPAAVCLAPVVVLIDYYLNRKFNLRTIVEKIPYFLLAIAFGIITMLAQKKFGALSALTDFKYVFTLFDKIFLISYAVMFYIIKAILPFNLCAIYYYPDKTGNMLPWIFYLAPAGITVIVVLVIWLKKIRRDLIFGFVFFLLTIALVLQFIPVGFTIVSDRYTYIPYLGLFFIVAKLYCDYTDKKFGNYSKAGKNLIIVLIAAVIVGFSYLTVERNKVWASGITLFTDVIAKNPTIGHAYWARGVGKYDMQDIKGALEDYDSAIAHNYRFPVAYNNKANCYYMMDSVKQAIAGYDEAIRMFDKYAMAYYNRGTARQKIGEYESSIADYKNSIKYEFEHLPWAYNGLGFSYYSLKDYPKALTNLNKAIELDPVYAVAYFNKGCVEYGQKQYNPAVADFTKAIELDAKYATAYFNRGIMKIALKDTANACDDFNKALELGYTQAIDAIKIYCK